MPSNNVVELQLKGERRPWGYFLNLHEEDGFKVKKLVVSPGQRLSLQSHKFRSEMWNCVRGKGTALIDGDVAFDEKRLYPGRTMYIPAECMHRLINTGKEDLVIIETQIGAYLGEDDIERYEDDYGRDV